MKRAIILLLSTLLLISAFALAACGDEGNYSVTYMVDGKSYAVKSAENGSSVENPADPVKRGFKFSGWCTESGETWSADEYHGANVTVTAVWEPMKYTATFMNGDEVLFEVEYDSLTEELDEPTPPEKEGYSAVWAEYTLEYYDITVDIIYEPITYTVTYNLNNANAIHSNKGSFTIESETFALKDAFAEKDEFLGWYLDAEFKTPAPSKIERGTVGDITLYARWDCAHSYKYTVIEPAGVFSEGIGLYKCSKCHYEYEGTIPATKSVKILAIGNSFSVDALEHLYGILKDGGVETIKLANLYIGGCSLDKHWSCMQSNSESYDLYLSSDTKEKMVKQSEKVSAKYAIELEDWDFITIQQNSGGSGIIANYGNLDNVIGYVKQHAPKAKLYWHMTWAYQSTYESGLSSYQNSQAYMYSSILNAVNTLIVNNEDIDGIITSGTAIQNLRTSYLGDNLTRDGYHLSYGVGRYTAALTWYAIICGADVDKINWIPSSYPEISEHLVAIKEAVKNAVANPLAITNSVYTAVDGNGGSNDND